MCRPIMSPAAELTAIGLYLPSPRTCVTYGHSTSCSDTGSTRSWGEGVVDVGAVTGMSGLPGIFANLCHIRTWNVHF